MAANISRSSSSSSTATPDVLALLSESQKNFLTNELGLKNLKEIPTVQATDAATFSYAIALVVKEEGRVKQISSLFAQIWVGQIGSNMRSFIVVVEMPNEGIPTLHSDFFRDLRINHPSVRKLLFSGKLNHIGDWSVRLKTQDEINRDLKEIDSKKVKKI